VQRIKILKFLLVVLAGIIVFPSQGQEESVNRSKFRQLKQELPTPNVYRTASGAPGHEYYQQKADYDMSIELDDKNQRISGVETITYHNNSPDELTYLWVQLDQNRRAKDSDTYKITTSKISDRMSFSDMRYIQHDFDGGFKLEYVQDGSGKKLPFAVNKTMMRVDLPQPLKAGGKYTFKIKWWYNINDRMKIGGRSGYEHFAEEDNYLYTIAQFFPRMAVYNEVEGWQNKQFLGRGEFTLPFGDYRVRLTVPSDHIVGATGVLQNSSQVLTSEQRSRFEKAKTADKPVIIVSEEEAREREKTKATSTKTWEFKAENVRDFAFASSRKFIWDAVGVKIGNRTVMAMSYYPKEGNPLWEQYSTHAVAHTIKVYSKFTAEYTYPVAISVHSNRIGMEYPMICFNGGRPEADGTYSERTKYGMISVIIHEVGHNFFPMIINSDERQWTWMDEGLNTFVQFLAEQEWDRNYPSRRGPAYKIVDYMKGNKSGISPIMTNSESIFQFGNNAYGKPATALNILRETVMGRELFDFAFKTYCDRWKFKHPTPADFFRTMEDASSVDLDWFWRGWFYGTDHVDISIDNVTVYQLDAGDPKEEKARLKAKATGPKKDISYERNLKEIPQTVLEQNPELHDFYTKDDRFEVTQLDERDHEEYMGRLNDQEKALIEAGSFYNQVQFSNVGGLVMPLIVEFEYTDGSTEIQHIPAEIWRFDAKTVTKVFVTNKEVSGIKLDPYRQTADVDVSNNAWPTQPEVSRFKLYKQQQRQSGGKNPMQRMRKANELE